MKDGLAEYWDVLPDQKLHDWQESTIQSIRSKLNFLSEKGA
jgi:hypothetical protein